jgi:hypothetical protein
MKHVKQMPGGGHMKKPMMPGGGMMKKPMYSMVKAEGRTAKAGALFNALVKKMGKAAAHKAVDAAK